MVPKGKLRHWVSSAVEGEGKASPTVSGCIGSGEGRTGWRPELLLTPLFPSSSGASARARGASGMDPLLEEVGRAGEKLEEG